MTTAQRSINGTVTQPERPSDIVQGERCAVGDADVTIVRHRDGAVGINIVRHGRPYTNLGFEIGTVQARLIGEALLWVAEGVVTT